MLVDQTVQTLFQNQRLYLNRFFDEIDFSEVQKILNLLLACKGVVVVSGVGKSGHIAQKISTTFVSTGTRSIFLSPTNALHGDIGFLSSEDLLLTFSKSGSSKELLDLIPHAKKRRTPTVAVVSSQNSKLAERSDFSIVLPIERELCPFDLAPTTSTAAQLIFGDCLAVALMQAKQFTVDDFAANHPAGFLGRKITFRVADLMIKEPHLPLCLREATLLEILSEFSSKKCGCMLVVDEQRHLLGIFTDGDLRRALQKLGSAALQKTMSELMTVSPRSISSDRLAFEALKQMEESPTRLITVLPVLEKGRTIGLLRMHDILDTLLS